VEVGEELDHPWSTIYSHSGLRFIRPSLPLVPPVSPATLASNRCGWVEPEQAGRLFPSPPPTGRFMAAC